MGEINERAKTEFLGNARRIAVSDRLARTVRACADRIHGLRYPSSRLSARLGARNRRRRGDRQHRRDAGRGDTGTAGPFSPSIVNTVRRRFEVRFYRVAHGQDYLKLYRSMLKRRTPGSRREGARSARDQIGSNGNGKQSHLDLNRDRGALRGFYRRYDRGAGTVGEAKRTLKMSDSFVVLDSHGDIGASPGGPDGFFHCDTRFSPPRTAVQSHGALAVGFECHRRQCDSDCRPDQPGYLCRTISSCPEKG